MSGGHNVLAHQCVIKSLSKKLNSNRDAAASALNLVIVTSQCCILHNIYCVYLKPSWANMHSYKDTRTEHENNKHISEPEETG